MPSWTAPFTAVTNAVVSSSDFNAGVRDNLLYLRQYLSADPGAANKVLVSSSSTAAGWTAMTDPTILSAIKVAAATPLVSAFTDLYAANKSGFFEVNSPGSGGPTGSGTWYVYNLVETNNPTTHGVQIAIDINDQNAIYMHTILAGVAGAWRRIWTAGNDGSGSTLDADLLDGVELAAINQVPLNAVVWFPTLADLTAAGASWTRHTALDGRLPVGAGTTFSQTFAEATNYGVNWTPSSGITIGAVPVLADGQTTVVNTGATTTVATATHTHPAPTLSGLSTAWLPPMRGGIWGRRI